MTPSPQPGITDSFDQPDLNPYWKPWTVGTGTLRLGDHVLRCAINPASDKRYSDSQITDYYGLPRKSFPWNPPLRLTVRAWASHSTNDLKGTAGFGLWNEPFVPAGFQIPRLPRAVWFFFGSAPHNMALAKGVPGHGWKAATLDLSRRLGLTMMPLAPLGFLLMRIPQLYRTLWPIGQRAIGVSERILPVDLVEPHTYELEWRKASVTFCLDGEQILVTPTAPRGPLGFIAWIDNQYAVVTPQGRFRWGLLPTTDQQWLALDQIEIQPLV
jgi:hypothetical protein